MSPRLDSALQLAAAGFHVFPISPGRKSPPAVKDWQLWATRDADAIRKKWAEADYNIGISTSRFGANGESLLVLDVDCRPNGKDGCASLIGLELSGLDLPTSLTVRTPTGGQHVYYTTHERVANTAGKLGKGLDTRGAGGYVVAPGSVVDGKHYERVGGEISPAPTALVERCKAPADSASKGKEAIAGANTGSARKRAIEFLQTAKPAIEGDGGDTRTYATAAQIKEFGVDEATAFDLMAEFYNPRCVPPWPLDLLQIKVRHAYEYSQRPQGSASPQADFSDFPAVDSQAPPQEPRLFFELFAAVAPDFTRSTLIEDLLDPGAMSVLYGESNTGKTFVALDAAFHIATGREWHGRSVEQGMAVYVAAEGGGAIRKRVSALRLYYQLDNNPVPLALVPCAVDLSASGADVQPLIELIGAAEQATGRKCAFVVVDTLSRAIGGANENAPDDMGAFVRNVDKIRAATNAHLMIVHHSGKDKAKGARGHSSLRAATDTELEVADRTIAVTKQRDMEPAKPICFDLVSVEIGKDMKGRPVTSCVVRPRNASAENDFAPAPLKAGSVAANAFAVLRELTFLQNETTTEAWRDAFIKKHYSENRKTGRRIFRRAVENLKHAQRITVEGGNASPTH
jgi:hypothetical protein